MLMKHRKLPLAGSGMAIFVLLASPSVRAADVNIGAPTGAQVGGTVDSAAGAVDAAKGTSKESVEKAMKDAANQEVDGAKEKAKSAAGQAIDSVGSGAEAH
jgi:hypothetical protein